MKKNLLLLLVSIFICLAIAELFCRWQGAYLWYNERIGAGGYPSPFQTGGKGWIWAYSPNQKRLMKGIEFTDSFTVNEDGLKELNISTEKKSRRILALGDSFTEGVGAPPDSSYPRILESLIKANGDSSVQVIDAGIGGSDIFFEYKLLQALMQKYKPDLVIDATNSSDISDCLVRGGFERFVSGNQLRYRNAPWFEPLYAKSFLVRRIVHDVFHYDFNFIRQKDYSSACANAQALMCDAVDSFQTLCSANQITFILMLQPMHADFTMPENYTMLKLRNHCGQKNIFCIDARDYLAAKGVSANNWQSVYWPIDNHFKSIGYSYLAQSVYRFMADKSILTSANGKPQ